jgi:hypothetical protein
MKFFKITAIVPFAALVIAGCSANGNQPQANENQTNVGRQEQKNELETLVAQSPSCEKPPMMVEWAGKKYSLKNKNTSAEPAMKFGYVSCEEGQFKIGDGGPGTLVVYSHGDPRTNHDLIFAGKWGLALYSMSVDLGNHNIIKLSFQPKEIIVPHPKAPGKNWTITKEQSIRDTVIIVYQDASGSEHALAKHAGSYYMLSGVYNAETVRIQPLEGEFGCFDLIGGVGSDQTAWDVLGLDKEGKLVMFSTIGRPEFADLDGNGTKELAASFEGAHLNFPNLELVRVNNGPMESAQVINANEGGKDQLYARLLNENGSYLIEIGKVREERSGRQYKYEDERLIEIAD